MSKENPNPSVLRRYPLAAACGGLAVLLLAAIGFRYSSQDEAAAELEQQRLDGQKVERNVRNAAGLEEHLVAVKAGVARLESMLIGIDDISANQEYFYRLESASGVRITVLSPLGAAKDATKANAYRAAGFSIVVEGGYAQVIAFLRALEQGTHLYRLTDFSLQGAGPTGDRPGVTPVALRLSFQLLGRNG